MQLVNWNKGACKYKPGALAGQKHKPIDSCTKGKMNWYRYTYQSFDANQMSFVSILVILYLLFNLEI